MCALFSGLYIGGDHEGGSSQRRKKYVFKLHRRRFRLNVRATVFSNRVINVWNDLPDNIVNAPSVNAFKNRLNKHWHGHPYKFEPACYQSGHPTREYSRNRQDAPFRS